MSPLTTKFRALLRAPHALSLRKIHVHTSTVVTRILRPFGDAITHTQNLHGTYSARPIKWGSTRAHFGTSESNKNIKRVGKSARHARFLTPQKSAQKVCITPTFHQELLMGVPVHPRVRVKSNPTPHYLLRGRILLIIPCKTKNLKKKRVLVSSSRNHCDLFRVCRVVSYGLFRSVVSCILTFLVV